jgi:ADP-ribosylglycohydrolase
MAVAAAASIAAGASPPPGRAFLREILPLVPASETRTRIEISQTITGDNLQEAVQKLGTGTMVSAQDTVPFCLWSAAYHLADFAEALWWTVRGLGDRDTTCAIVGGIVALSAQSVPAAWIMSREPLPEEFRRF